MERAVEEFKENMRHAGFVSVQCLEKGGCRTPMACCCRAEGRGKLVKKEKTQVDVREVRQI